VSDLPAEAVQAAAEALTEVYKVSPRKEAEPLAHAALEAAAPAWTAQVRRETAEQIRTLARWEFNGGYVGLYAFMKRHPRLEGHNVTALSMDLEALADEIENPPARQIGEAP
jgi:hypothetical protein